MAYALGTHVRSLATHYDDGTQDKNGFTYSQRLAAKGIFRLVIPPLSRYCDFAPFLAGNGVWCYGKVSHVYVLTRRSLEQSYRVKWDDGTSMKVPKVFWAPLLFSSIVSSPLLFSFMRISVVHVPSLISRMCSRKLSSHKSLLMLKWRLR